MSELICGIWKCKSYEIKFHVFVFNFPLDMAVGDKKDHLFACLDSISSTLRLPLIEAMVHGRIVKDFSQF